MIPGIDLLVAAALLLAAVGVVGSVVPGVPGALGSLAGLGFYWYATGYADPGTLVFAVLLLTCLVALAADVLAGPLAARLGGAEARTSVLAGVVGFALLFVAGPLGVVAGIAGTVFAVEYRRHGDPDRALRAAVATTVGALGSIVVQLLATLAVLGSLLVLVLL
ncbi:DUF456 family protein [Halosegnis marinus]|uniref:DUF456 family protein n=1 Tax=Halosegnis marinus TaxID=3034023 RepID=A0ABD5ZTC5_9EURY|nr:DUF456 family protein [Halosegnis sp. DT85]